MKDYFVILKKSGFLVGRSFGIMRQNRMVKRFLSKKILKIRKSSDIIYEILSIIAECSCFADG